MTEQKRKFIIYIIFVLAIIYGAANLYPKKRHERNLSDIQSAVQLNIAKNIIKKHVTHELINTPNIHKKSWGNDPFHTLNKRKIKSHQKTYNNLKLSGIIHNEFNPVAIINKKSLRIGDRINNAKVVKINKENVILKVNGKNIKLTISKG